MPSYELHSDPVLVDPGDAGDEKVTPPHPARLPRWKLDVTVHFDSPIDLLHPPAFQGIDENKQAVFTTSTTLSSDRNAPVNGQGGGVAFDTATDPETDPEAFKSELHAHLCEYAEAVQTSALKQASPPQWFSYAFTGKRVDASQKAAPVEVSATSATSTVMAAKE